ncbi:MAG: methyltransferase domain-containing protein [Thermoplasmata archaeon]|nr:methyltransferase domain-containing protein [Thermoplasmata archaeon]
MKDEFKRRMYDDLVWTWPLISHPASTEREARLLSEFIKGRAVGPVETLLHLGSGGGHMDFTLKEQFQVTGVDLSEGMAGHARTLNPEAEYLIGDMRDVRLGRTFDAVTILDSITYMISEAELKAAFETAWAHLRPGGVFLTYAETTKEGYVNHETYIHTGEKGNTSVTIVEVDYDPDPDDTTVEYTVVYLIRRDDKLTIETERHIQGLFPLEVWPRTLESVGFDVEQRAFKYSSEWADIEYPLFLCRKPMTDQ